ncbi:hypothetical protein [Paraburkholderia sp. MM5482-R1]|uniref:hypothetical protein n=1 Tax=unclassified Paraburkholderia TaxID=2615204 RepID=UPI003D1B25AF
MLYSIDAGKYIIEVPHEKDFRRWTERLSTAEYDAIVDKLNSRLSDGTVHTAGWIPGNDWSRTVYEPIYRKACENDEVESGKCFGLFVWVVLQQRSDVWGFGRYEKDGTPIRSLTYFRIENPPAR